MDNIVDVKFSGDGKLLDKGLKQWTLERALVGHVALVHVAGSAGTRSLSHETWIRFRGRCMPMCGSEDFWMKFGGSSCSEEMLKSMAFQGKIDPYSPEIATLYTQAVAKWWSDSIRISKAEKAETTTYITGFQGALSSNFKDFTRTSTRGTPAAGESIVPYLEFECR